MRGNVMKQSKITGLIFLIFGFLMFLIFFQCYTTFKHPPISSNADSTEAYHSKEINFLEDCSSCHEQNNPINDSHLQVYDDPLYQDNYNWQYYYVIPWWIDAYYYEDNMAQQKDILPAPQRRDFDRRETPTSSATPSSGTPGASLAKPSTNTSSSSEPSSSETPPQKRNERREIAAKEKSQSQQPTNTGPERRKREDDKTKKEKE
jgi:hypothetical protein